MKKDYHLDRSYIQNPLEFGEVYVYQIGRLFCSSETVVDTHIHRDLFELTVVTEGRGIITTNGVPVPVERGDIYLSLPCDAHKIASDAEKPLKYDFFAFNCRKDCFRQALEHIAQNYYSANTRIFHDERVRSLVSNAIAEMNQEYVYAEEVLAAIFQQIVVYVIRGFQEVVPERYCDTVTHAEALCYRLMNYIDTHIYSLKRLEELGDIMDYSYGYLSALFKKTTSNTLSHYYQEKKLDAARLLILEKKFKVTEIAEMLNYTSVYAFSKAFSRRYGVSPRNYKNGVKSDFFRSYIAGQRNSDSEYHESAPNKDEIPPADGRDCIGKDRA